MNVPCRPGVLLQIRNGLSRQRSSATRVLINRGWLLQIRNGLFRRAVLLQVQNGLSRQRSSVTRDLINRGWLLQIQNNLFRRVVAVTLIRVDLGPRGNVLRRGRSIMARAQSPCDVLNSCSYMFCFCSRPQPTNRTCIVALYVTSRHPSAPCRNPPGTLLAPPCTSQTLVYSCVYLCIVVYSCV